MVSRWLRAVAGTALLLLSFHRAAAAHPLHTTLTEITADPARRALHIVIRVFADDFARAATASRRPGSGAPDAATYLRGAFVLTEGRRALPLRSCGTRRSGELLWLCLEADAPASLASLQLRDALLWELFDDQVNIVRSMLGRTPRSMLYTRGDKAKALL